MSLLKRLPVSLWTPLPAAAIALAAAGCSGDGTANSAASPMPTARGSATAPGPATATKLQDAYVSVIRRVLPSVVEIRTATGLGSGVVSTARATSTLGELPGSNTG